MSRAAIPKIVSTRTQREADRGRALLPPAESNIGSGRKGLKTESVNSPKTCTELTLNANSKYISNV